LVVWDNGKALHPTQKPEEMLKRIILASSNEGDIVLDPFSGSGTTVYIAKKYNRKWIGIEKDKNYIKISIDRLRQTKTKYTPNDEQVLSK
jgi:site-specific DNA-methyltransferase (adenine-specific)/modification methylase